MYDRTWARSVYEKYAKLYTRVQQIDLCILQTAEAKSGRQWPRMALVRALIDSIQYKQHKQLWPLYKRLVKRTPLDKELLETVTKVTLQAMGDEICQFSFEFTA